MLTVRRWWGDGVALLGGLLYAVDPWSKHYVALVLSETLAGTVALALLYVFTRAWERPTWARWLGAGALAGALALVRAVFVIAPALLVLAALVRRGTTRERLTRAAATAAASARAARPRGSRGRTASSGGRRCRSGARATTSCSPRAARATGRQRATWRPIRRSRRG